MYLGTWYVHQRSCCTPGQVITGMSYRNAGLNPYVGKFIYVYNQPGHPCVVRYNEYYSSAAGE